jgi:HSP20 family protein
MNALTRVDPFDQLFPEVFRRLAWPLRVADDVPGDIRLDVTEKDKLYEVRAQIPASRSPTRSMPRA